MLYVFRKTNKQSRTITTNTGSTKRTHNNTTQQNICWRLPHLRRLARILGEGAVVGGQLIGLAALIVITIIIIMMMIMIIIIILNIVVTIIVIRYSNNDNVAAY